MITLTLLSAIFVAGSVQDVAAPDSSECEAGVQSVLESIAALHWNPLLRARASSAEGLPRKVCHDGTAMQTGVQRALEAFDDPAMRFLDRTHFERMLEEWNGVGDELRAVLEQRSDAAAIILDLRGNPGGLVTELVAVAGVFLKQGSSIARMTGPDSSPLRSEAVPVADDTPVIVLIDAGTASAAEVLAAALRAAGARLYGARTFGKGLAHQAVAVAGEWMFMLPVAQLETPEGRAVLRNGIDPDVRTSNALEQALRDLRRGDVPERRRTGS